MAKKVLKKTKLGAGYFKWAEGVVLDTDFVRVEWYTYFLDEEKLIVHLNYYQKKDSITNKVPSTLGRTFEFTKNNENNITNFIANELSNADFITEVGVGVIPNFHKGATDEPTPSPAPTK